jgi:hypothetical protein
MNTKIIAMVMGAFFFTQTGAQVYFNVGAGYGLTTAPSGYLNNGTSMNGTVYTNTITVKSGLSYGKGTQILFAAGTMINTNIGVELGVNYLAGAKYTNTYTATGNFSYNETYTRVGSMLRLCPTLVLTTGKSKVKPYMKTGLVVGISPKIKETDEQLSTNSGNSNYLSKYETQGNVSFGFTNSLGLNIALSNSLSFFGEFNIITQAWAPQKRIATLVTQNGVDQLPVLQNYYKEIDFVSSVINNGTTDFNAPRQSLKVSYAYSSVGLNVGLHLSMGSKGSAKTVKKKK